MRAFFLSCAVAVLVFGAVPAGRADEEKLANWHQWRGPLANGVAPQGNPPVEWSTTKNVRWKVVIPGRGSASPIVWGDRIFILTAIKTDRTEGADDDAAASAEGGAIPARFVAHSLKSAASDGGPDAGQLAQRDDRGGSEDRPRGEGFRRGEGGFSPRGGFGRGGRGFGIQAPENVYQFVVMCIDRKTGETIWQRTAIEAVPHEGHHQTGTFASASPVTDGKLLFASFGSRGIHCFDLDGNPKWSKDLGDMRTRMSFGEGASPALHKDTLVHTWDHEGDSFIVALDATTGEEKWRKPREEPSTWATPLVVETGGRTQVITSGTTRIRSYDLETGEVIWECGGMGSNPIASPLVYENLAICMTGHHDPAGIAVPLDAKGDVTDTAKVAWRIEESTPYVASPVLYDGTIYFTKSRNAILSAVDARTGEYFINQKRLPGLESIYASPVAAKGRIYFPSREGVTVVIEHGPNLEVIASNDLEETIDASPAIVDDEMIIRTESSLYCIAEE